MKKPIPLLLFALLLWILGGAFLWKTTCCLPGITGLMVKDGATSVAANASNNFHFGLAGATPVALETVNGDLKGIADYLTKHPNKYLTIEGQYGANEKFDGASSGFANLGLARADKIKAAIAGMMGAGGAAQLFTGSKLNNTLTFSDDKTYDAINWTFTNVERKISFIDSEGKFNNEFADDFLFQNSKFEYALPLSGGLTAAVGKTAEYLKKDGKRSMLITGYYGKDEKNVGSVLPDLGLSRANAIKKAFTDLGVPPNLINIDSKMKEGFFWKGLSSAATYSFGASGDGADRLAEVEKRLRARPLVLYFQTNSANLNLSAEQRQYMADVIYYLDNKKGATVNSVGHTDNVGDLKNNTRLSRKRAEFVKNYLTKNNINGKQIGVNGKGPSQPTATNDTSDGRAKNRRVEISINK